MLDKAGITRRGWQGLFVTDTKRENTPSPTGNEERLTQTQALVVELINRLLSASIERVDAAVDDALAQIGTFTGRDRAYVFVIDGQTGSNTHEWCADGTDAMIDQLQNLPVDAFDWMLAPIRGGDPLHVPDIADFAPGSDEYAFLSEQGIRSLLIVPMFDEGRLMGLVGFDSVHNAGDFLPGEIYLLRSFADVVRSVLMRRRTTLAMRRTQEELARERAFLSGIVSTNAAGFVVLDGDGVIIYANDAAENVLGVTVAEMMGQAYNAPQLRITDLNGQPVPDEREPFTIVQRTGQIVLNHRIALHCPDGTRYASINAAPIAEADVRASHVVYAVTDVTHLVHAEQAREAALADAHRANVAKSNFLAKMSHEIRTPLNGILGITEILQDMVADKAQTRMLDILGESGGLLMGIINDLLDMSKIEADALELDRVPFALADLARRTEEVHTLRASEKQLSFAVTVEDGAARPRLGDPQRLTQILHNMISNAIKFTEQGHVRVTIAAADAAHIRLQVSDSGIGMDSAQVARMYDAFAQADSTISRRFGGTGLGMSIVHNLVELMDGTIETDSTPGAGTTITVTLPVPVAPEDATTETAAPPGAPQPADSVAHDITVLAADDNRTNQMILSIMLGQLGAHVTLAHDGLDALEKFRADRFDLVIFDISMPGMDGVALLETVRRLEGGGARPRTPAIAFTANAMDHQVQGYLDAGFDDCLTKPLKQDRLAATLARVLAPTTVG